MKLTPLDVRKQEFKKVLRGYDPDEVEAFLVMVADELEFHLREKNQLNDELIKLRTQLRDYQRVEATLRETLMKAQSAVDDTRANSQREAELIIRKAELEAESILKEGREELAKIQREINLLHAQKDSFVRRLRQILESQLEMLELMEDDAPGLRQPSHTDQFAQNQSSEPATPMHERDAERPRIVRPASRTGNLDLSRDMRDKGIAADEDLSRNLI
ncbi:MAG: DivIVA domain-containing protein [candidate division KSB1 bacterium]|nr:DivIVA domain-containing protein [candidate division KSB1 bacterium]